jgi:hypothetical protein
MAAPGDVYLQEAHGEGGVQSYYEGDGDCGAEFGFRGVGAAAVPEPGGEGVPREGTGRGLKLGSEFFE